MMKRKIKIEKTFQKDGDFQSLYAACKWIEENGYSYGSSQVGGPTAIFKGNGHYVSKWRNLSCEERNSVDGLMDQDGDNREGPVIVRIFE